MMNHLDCPRPEYPRPQFVRQVSNVADSWINLNGVWSYVFDFGKSGHQRGFPESQGFEKEPYGGEILVPFCPESSLSGVEHKDFIEAMWYHRRFTVPADWTGKQVWLRFGGVDYHCEVFIDGHLVGRHWGGTVGFGFNITSWISPGKTHDLVVAVRDDVRSGKQPGGKQCPDYASRGCHYTRTTGIWQTVWLEAASPFGLSDAHIVPDLDGERFIVTPYWYALKPGLRLRATLKADGEVISQAVHSAVNGVPVVLPTPDPQAWSPANPFLYDLLLEVVDGEVVLETVRSYAGLRKIHIEGNRIFLNNEPLYLRLVLDQGFYPEGIWTAPSDEALRHDIELSLAAGFNGARLHQKVFEPRFHYWADRLGYLTWGESSSWGINMTDEVSARNFLSEWREIVMRDRNHPSIIAWTPFNETRIGAGHPQHARLQSDAYDVTHSLDATRPVNDASGYVHVKTDLWTVHTYEQDPDRMREQLSPGPDGTPFRCFPDVEAPYEGQPYIVDEYGGIKWIADEDHRYTESSWGYGTDPQTLEEFYTRLEGLTDVILSLDHVCGYCYTQLTDIEQEQNGIYNYDRSTKFDMQRIAQIFSKVPERYKP
ncbi:MAG TPA: beta-glucuronidase [Chloroflexi bacterium]|nr:beta-glucuronidase [Chloroflexota bacterium]